MLGLLLTVLMACTDGHDTSTKGCYEVAAFIHPQWCAWVMEGNIKHGEDRWGNGWQAWYIRCVERDGGES